jgi:hypothetical protein
MRHQKMFRAKARPITARRLQAAERFLKKQRESMPLFAEQIAAEQPTAVERIENFEAGNVETVQYRRDHEAAAWRKIRARVAALPESAQRVIRHAWQHSQMPASSSYLAYYLDHWYPGLVDKIAAGHRFYVCGVGDEPRIVLFEPNLKMQLHYKAGPFADYWAAAEAAAQLMSQS